MFVSGNKRCGVETPTPEQQYIKQWKISCKSQMNEISRFFSSTTSGDEHRRVKVCLFGNDIILCVDGDQHITVETILIFGLHKSCCSVTAKEIA